MIDDENNYLKTDALLRNKLAGITKQIKQLINDVEFDEVINNLTNCDEETLEYYYDLDDAILRSLNNAKQEIWNASRIIKKRDYYLLRKKNKK
jgi:hypothetical protein